MRDPIDDTPLTRAPTRLEVERVRDEAARGDLGRRTAQELAQPSSSAVAFWLVGGTLGFVVVATIVVELVKGGGNDVGVGFGFLAAVVVIALGVAWLVRGADRRGWRRTVRLVLFAQANGLEVQPVAPTQAIPGIAGRSGEHAGTRNLVSWTVAGRQAHVADYHWGYNSGSIDCRYLAVELGVELPGMSFLCGRNGMQRPEARFGPETFEGASYSLRLGGLVPDPRARALFTDELVALLTDPADPTNAEVVDGWFVGYVRRSTGLRPEEWRHAFAVADLVTSRAALLRS